MQRLQTAGACPPLGARAFVPLGRGAGAPRGQHGLRAHEAPTFPRPAPPRDLAGLLYYEGDRLQRPGDLVDGAEALGRRSRRRRAPLPLGPAAPEAGHYQVPRRGELHQGLGFK